MPKDSSPPTFPSDATAPGMKTITVRPAKPGFGPYFGSFLGAWGSSSLIEDELRAATGFQRPASTSMIEMFKPETWKQINAAAKDAGTATVLKEVGGEIGILAASLLPGAAFGYWALTPRSKTITVRAEPAASSVPTPASTAAEQAETKVQAAIPEGKLQAEETKQHQTASSPSL